MALLANLTLLPALLAVLGRSVFWPRIPRVGGHKGGTWGRIAGKVVGRPVLTLVIGLVIFGGLALSMLAYSANGFNDQPPPATSDSGRGLAVLTANFPVAENNPTTVVFRLPVSVWTEPGALAEAQQGLVRSGQFTAVTGALDPDTGTVTPTALAEAHDQLASDGSRSHASGDTAAGGQCATRRLPRLPGLGPVHQCRRTHHPVPDRVAGRWRQQHRGRRSHALGARRRWTGSAARSEPPPVASAATPPWRPTSARLSGNDLLRIIPIVMIVLALLLAIVLRSLVAPLYLVVSVGLSYLASLGLCVLVFELIGGQDGINFVLPFFMFIFIMALGQDYNILVMTRIREEAHHAPIKVAVRRAVEATGTTVTSAGLILAGTFGVLTVTGNTQVQEIGLGLAAGILLDTFFVRTLLVPSVVVLLGRWNWWPTQLSHEDHSHDPVLPDDDCSDDSGVVEPLVRPLATAPH